MNVDWTELMGFILFLIGFTVVTIIFVNLILYIMNGGFQMEEKKQLNQLQMVKIFMSFNKEEKKVIKKYLKTLEEETKKLNKGI